MKLLDQGQDIERTMRSIGAAARGAAAALAQAAPEAKTAALREAAAALRAERATLLAANARDLAEAGAGTLSGAMRDRLLLDERRVEAMATGLEEVAALPDPIGTVLDRRTRPNGLDIARVRVPLGVIGLIYEARPNVTADAGGLCLRSGNAAILRCGSESFQSSTVIAAA